MVSFRRPFALLRVTLAVLFAGAVVPSAAAACSGPAIDGTTGDDFLTTGPFAEQIHLRAGNDFVAGRRRHHLLVGRRRAEELRARHLLTPLLAPGWSAD